MKFSIQSPTRIDLAGGTLDFWPIYLMIEKSMTINAAIDIYTAVDVETHAAEDIHIHVDNLNFKKTYKNSSEFFKSKDKEVQLVKVVAAHFGDVGGYKMTTRSESPVGGGLGGSSSLCISLIKAFLQLSQQKMSLDAMVQLAANLEAKILRTPTGCQDHYGAASGGVKAIRFLNQGPKSQILDVDLDYFNERCFLVDTGKSHHSGINNWQVYKAVIDGDAKVVEALESVRNVTQKMYQVIVDKQYSQLKALFADEYKARVDLAECFSSPEIEDLKRIVDEYSESTVKICGAGGGGCVLVWTEPQTKSELAARCEAAGYKPLMIRLVGSEEESGAATTGAS